MKQMGDFGFFNVNGWGHIDVILQIIKLTGCNKYLELGIYDGYNISEISKFSKRCVGVDIRDDRRHFSYDFKLMKTDDFFIENNEMFDIIFIDADHNFESVKTDFINSLKILNKHGIIFLHDTDPISEEYVQPHYCGDSYKMIDWFDENYPELNTLTMPITEAGLTIVNRKVDRRVLNYKK